MHGYKPIVKCSEIEKFLSLFAGWNSKFFSRGEISWDLLWDSTGLLMCILQVIPRLFRLRAGTHVFWGKFESSSSDRVVDQRVSWIKPGTRELNLSIDWPCWEGVQHSVLAMVPQHI